MPCDLINPVDSKNLEALVRSQLFFLAAFILSSGLVLARADEPKRAPNKAAPKGGVFTVNLHGEPMAIHPIMSTDVYALEVHNYIADHLLVRDAETYEWRPRLAEKYDISKDGKTYTFFLRKNAVFHDGKPITAADVKFSFDAIFEPSYKAQHLVPYFEGIAKVEVLDPYTVKVTAKDTYFKNFDTVAGLLQIIPKHIYGEVSKSIKMTRQYVGSGPYTLQKFGRGQQIVIKKFDKWYGYQMPEYKGQFNFSEIHFLFLQDEDVILEKAESGDLDYVELRPESFVQKTNEAPWGTTLIKKKVENLKPVVYSYIGWNLRRELFQDKNVRWALAHLLNRDEINKKYRFDMAELARGPVYNKSEYASPHVKAVEFNPTKAAELLAKAGWKDSDKNGVLEKSVNGKTVEFRFTLLNPNKDSEKYWALYKEELKKAGVAMDVKYMEWNPLLNLLDEGKFDAAALAWGGGDIDWDPKQIWHSSSAVVGGSNFISYRNSEVDRLIDEARLTLDKAKRVKVLRQVYEKIAADAPYAFLFNDKFYLYGVSQRLGQPTDTFKYDVGESTWWVNSREVSSK